MAQSTHRDAVFLQGDATNVPLASGCADTVVMLGGVHHVTARAAFFSEVERILRSGVRFVYREPVDDFVLWRMIRALVYRVSPMLDHRTERPLRHEETVPVLARAGLRTVDYRTHGFLGFCLFMNSDVLVFNRLFRFFPGIRKITGAAATFDRVVLRWPGLRRAGLQVIGIAIKPNVGGFR